MKYAFVSITTDIVHFVITPRMHSKYYSDLILVLLKSIPTRNIYYSIFETIRSNTAMTDPKVSSILEHCDNSRIVDNKDVCVRSSAKGWPKTERSIRPWCKEVSSLM